MPVTRYLQVILKYDYLSKYGEKINKVPAVLRKTISSIMNVLPAEQIPYFKNKHQFANRYEKLKELLKNPSILNLTLSLSQQYNNNNTFTNCFLNKIENLPTLFESTELDIRTL